MLNKCEIGNSLSPISHYTIIRELPLRILPIIIPEEAFLSQYILLKYKSWYCSNRLFFWLTENGSHEMLSHQNAAPSRKLTPTTTKAKATSV